MKASAAPLRAPLLLIVDDDPTARKVTMSYLKRGNYEFREAANGKEALRAVQEKEPDLVLLDVMMPGIDGFEVCRRMRQLNTQAYLPIMLLTALDNVRDLEKQGLTAGADDFITKPVSKVELNVRVRSMLRIRTQNLELVEQAHQLEEVINQREDVVRMVVHDLRSPVTAIQLLASDLLANHPAPEQQLIEDLQMLKEEARRVGNYLEEILLVARQEEGRLSLSLERVDLAEVANDTIRALAPVARARGISLKGPNASDLSASGHDVKVLGDKALLRRVIDNLLTNAIKFSPPNTQVEVQVGTEDQDGKTVWLDVVDEGRGVPEQMRGKIFEKFEVVKVRAAGGPQTGLGLPFCRKIVEAHGGYISCLPREPKGSRFHVTLPSVKSILAI